MQGLAEKLVEGATKKYDEAVRALQESRVTLQRAMEQLQKNTEVAREHVENMTETQKKVALGAGSMISAYVFYRIVRSVATGVSHRRREKQLKAMEEDGMLHLMIFPRSPWAPSISAPCTKVETFLRLSQIPYTVTETLDPHGSPNNGLPFIVYNSRRVAESQQIIEFLTRTFSVTLDSHLSLVQRSLGSALNSAMDYTLGPAFDRIAFVENPAIATEMLHGALGVSRGKAHRIARSMASVMRKHQSTTAFGALTKEQFCIELLRDCEAIELQVGDQLFLFGDSPCTYDCSVYARLAPFANMKQIAELDDVFMTVAQSPVLLEYLQRMTKHAFPDLKDIAAATTAAQTKLGDIEINVDDVQDEYSDEEEAAEESA